MLAFDDKPTDDIRLKQYRTLFMADVVTVSDQIRPNLDGHINANFSTRRGLDDIKKQLGHARPTGSEHRDYWYGVSGIYGERYGDHMSKGGLCEALLVDGWLGELTFPQTILSSSQVAAWETRVRNRTQDGVLMVEITDKENNPLWVSTKHVEGQLSAVTDRTNKKEAPDKYFYHVRLTTCFVCKTTCNRATARRSNLAVVVCGRKT
jgi:hypothetical protein